jgi:PhzF family phenazine biosynthesis protein
MLQSYVLGITGTGGLMKQYAFKKMGAFATDRSGGNPAGAIYLEDGQEISPHEMQRIALELKGFVSEVGYVTRINTDTFGLKYYSSEREVDFCGHATIAIMYDIFKNDSKLKKKRFINIRTNKGTLRVENRIEHEDAVFISAPMPRFSSSETDRTELAHALQTQREVISDTHPLSVVNAGLETLIVPMNTLQDILALAPDLEELKQFCLQNSLDIITVFTEDVSDRANAYRTRVFAPTFGYLEDPATGSGNAAFGCYLREQGKWDGSPISIEQNGDHSRPNIVKLSAEQSTGGEMQVVFGGSAITRITGKYLLP